MGESNAEHCKCLYIVLALTTVLLSPNDILMTVLLLRVLFSVFLDGIGSETTFPV